MGGQIFKPGTLKVMPLNLESILRGNALIKDQTIFTLFILEETQNVIINNIYSAYWNGQTTRAGELCHKAINEIMMLLTLTAPPLDIDFDNIVFDGEGYLTTPQISLNVFGAFITANTFGASLSFNFFSRTCIEMFKYYRQQNVRNGVNLTDDQYWEDLNASTPATFTAAQTNPWSLQSTQFMELTQYNGDNTSFYMFIYEESFNTLNKLLKNMAKDGDLAGCARIAHQYIPELVTLIEWTNPTLLGSIVPNPTLALTKGMSLSYNMYFRATLTALMYYRTLDSSTYLDTQYKNWDGTTATFPESINDPPAAVWIGTLANDIFR